MNFKFLNLGKRVKVFVNAVLAQVNTFYDDTDDITVEKQNVNDFGEPYDEIQYQGFKTNVGASVLKSNIAKIIVNFPPDKISAPSSADDNVLILNNQQIDIVDNIPYNASVDRLKIISFNNIGNLSYNDSNISNGKEIMQYDFKKIKFKSNPFGIGNPYQEIKYKVGNSLGYTATVYSLKVNIDGFASLLEVGDVETKVQGAFKLISYNLKVQNGVVNKSAKISIETSLPVGVFSSPESNVKILYRGGQVEVTENGTVDFVTTLDQNGQDNILLNIDLNLADNNIDGFIKFVLLEIDENPALVSATNEQTLTLTAI